MSDKKTYEQKFIENLQKKTVKSLDEWVYAGGDRGSHWNWFMLNHLPDEKPIYRIECICTHSIEENCYIRNKETDEFVVVGNCCIKKVNGGEIKELDIFLGRVCKNCSKPTRNRKDAYCNGCRGGIIKIGKYKGVSYKTVSEGDPSYCNWALKNCRKFSDEEFIDWLEENFSDYND